MTKFVLLIVLCGGLYQSSWAVSISQIKQAFDSFDLIYAYSAAKQKLEEDALSVNDKTDLQEIAGLSLFYLARYADAEQHLLDFLRQPHHIDPFKYGNAYLFLITTFLFQNKVQEAANYLEDAPIIVQERSFYLYLKAKVLFQKEDFSGSLYYYNCLNDQNRLSSLKIFLAEEEYISFLCNIAQILDHMQSTGIITKDYATDKLLEWMPHIPAKIPMSRIAKVNSFYTLTARYCREIRVPKIDLAELLEARVQDLLRNVWRYSGLVASLGQ